MVSGLSEFQWQPPKRNDKADRKKNGLWQISAVFCWNILKGETKGRWGGRGAGVGFKVGDGAKLMAWKHTSACMETRKMQQPSLCSATERLFVFEDGGLVKRCITHPHPTSWQICPSWCRLFVILNWQRAQKARVLHKPYPVWLCAEELIPPKTLIDILPWCRGICGAPAAKPTAGQGGRLGYLYMRSVWGLHRIIDGKTTSWARVVTATLCFALYSNYFHVSHSRFVKSNKDEVIGMNSSLLIIPDMLHCR